MAAQPKPDIEAGLKHIGSHSFPEDFETAINTMYRLWDEERHSASSPLTGISIKFDVLALRSVFVQRNITSAKRWFYASARADSLANQVRRNWDSAACHPTFFYTVLLSDHKPLIHWFGQFLLPVCYGGIKATAKWRKPGSYEHFCVQFGRAITGQWTVLAEECEKGIQTGGKHLLDYRFMLALAQQDLAAMEAVLALQFQGRDFNKRRTDFAFGSIERLMHGWGVIYCKIAQLHGFDLLLDTPWIPAELIPFKPLPDGEYKTGIELIDGYDIFTPFNDNPEHAIYKFPSVFSPKPPGQLLDPEVAVKQAYELEQSLKQSQKKGKPTPKPTKVQDMDGVKVIGDMPLPAKYELQNKLREKTIELVETTLTNRGLTLHSGGQLPDGTGFEHVASTHHSNGNFLVAIFSSRVPIRDGEAQLEFDDQGLMQFSPEWIDRIMNQLPDDSDAKQVILKADVLNTVLIGMDEVTGEMKMLKVNATNAEEG